VRFVALLRGINVGGNNLIRMTDLRACFEKHGFRNVTTYIQSGNVVFESGEAGSSRVARRIEEILAATFNYPASLVLLDSRQMRAVIDRAPQGFGTQPAKYRYDVVFLKAPLTATVALESVPAKPGVDQVFAGSGVLYITRLIAKATQSGLSRVVSLPIYQNMTIRNWNTTTKLHRMMEGPGIT